MTIAIDEFLHQLENFLSTKVDPVSYALDHDAHVLKTAYAELVALGALCLQVPTAAGGMGGERIDWIKYNVLMAQHSGALLFLQAQHQLIVSHLKKLATQDVGVVTVLRTLAQAKQGVGAALAANRNLLQVTATEQGFLLSGKLLWVTGYQYFPKVLLSFDYHGENFYILLPFAAMGDQIDISPPIDTAVFKAAQTVSVTLKNYYVDKEAIIAKQVSAPIASSPIEHPSIYNFAGAAKACLTLAQQGKYREDTQIQAHANLLQHAWEDYYQRMLTGDENPLNIRAQGLALAERCARFARMSCGSAAILATHPLARISREIWQYAVAIPGVAHDQLSAYLNYL